MAAIARLLAGRGPNVSVDMVGIAAHDVEQLAFARGLEIGDRGLDQMAGAVELVAVAQIGPALAGLHADEPANSGSRPAAAACANMSMMASIFASRSGLRRR